MKSRRTFLWIMMLFTPFMGGCAPKIGEAYAFASSTGVRVVTNDARSPFHECTLTINQKYFVRGWDIGQLDFSVPEVPLSEFADANGERFPMSKAVKQIDVDCNQDRSEQAGSGGHATVLL